MRMLWRWLVIIVLLPKVVIANDEDLPFDTGADMAQWCKEISYSHLSVDADRLYNWTQSVLAKGNTYVVRGHWRVNDEDIYVECKSRIGALRKYATYRENGW